MEGGAITGDVLRLLTRGAGLDLKAPSVSERRTPGRHDPCSGGTQTGEGKPSSLRGGRAGARAPVFRRTAGGPTWGLCAASSLSPTARRQRPTFPAGELPQPLEWRPGLARSPPREPRSSGPADLGSRPRYSDLRQHYLEGRHPHGALSPSAGVGSASRGRAL